MRPWLPQSWPGCIRSQARGEPLSSEALLSDLYGIDGIMTAAGDFSHYPGQMLQREATPYIDRIYTAGRVLMAVSVLRSEALWRRAFQFDPDQFSLNGIECVDEFNFMLHGPASGKTKGNQVEAVSSHGKTFDFLA